MAKKSTKSHFWRFQKTFQLPDPSWMAHLPQGLRFNLPDALTRDTKLSAHLFKCPAVAIDQAEALFQYLALTIRQRLEHVFDFFLQQNDRRHVARVFCPLIFDKIPEVCFFT